MATPGERFKNWIDTLATAWSARLGGWLGTALGAGFDAFMKILGKSFAPKIKPIIDKIEANTTIPPELQKIWEELKAPSGEVSALLADRLAGGIVGGAISSVVEWMLRPIQYGLSNVPGYFLPKAELLIGMYQRRLIDRAMLDEAMRQYGIDPPNVNKLLEMGEVRFPSEIVSELWLRDKAKYEQYWDDVYTVTGIQKKKDIEDPRILALKELAYHMPSFRDVVGFLAHEVFEPKMIAKYGLDDEWGELDKTMFEKVGLKEDMALNYWRDHWQHASWSQIQEMLHRGAMNEQDVYDWFRLVEIPPFWRKGLTATMYNLPGRIEIRMMAMYQLIDKPKIMELLRKDGLAEEYVKDVADMNIVRGIRTDIQTRYTKKWINSEEVKAEIAKYDLEPEIATRLYQWIVSNTAGDRTAAEKDLTAAEIIKGVKKGMLTWDEGVQQLIALGYDAVEANYKLAIDVEVTEAAPTTELNTRVDTLRRRRRQRTISRSQEIADFLELGLDTGLATAYADNDDLRLVKVAVVKPPEVKLEYQTDDGKVKVETIRLSRRQRRISRDEEIMELMELEMSDELAISYSDNDELRLAVVKPPVPVVIVALYQTELGKVNVDTFRRARRDRLISRDEEIRLLTDLDMPADLAISYADNDDIRLTPVKIEMPPVVMPYYQTAAGKVDADTIRRKRQQRQLYEELTSAQIALGVVPRLLAGDEAHNEEVRLLKRLDLPDELAIAYANNDDLRLIKEATGEA